MLDLDTIVQCKKGDSKSWEKFIKLYGPLAQAIARRYFSLTLEDIENITQNVFIKLFEGGLAHFRGTTEFEFRAYYKTIVLNEAKTYLQKEKRWKDKVEDLFLISDESVEDNILTKNPIENIEYPSPKPDQIAEGKEIILIIEKSLQNISLRERQLFLLKLKGYKEKDISQIIGIPMGSVASSYSRIIEKIQKSLKKNGMDSI
jgi:RNA polymerase sigma-70 factor, ECF subfamily